MGAPHPVAGNHLVVPVTTHPLEGEPVTSLWRIDPGNGERRLLARGQISGVAVSDNGVRLAYLKKAGDDKQVFVQHIDGGEGLEVTDLPLGAVGVRWLPDDRLVVLATLWADHPTLEETRDHEPPSVEVLATENAVYRYWDAWIRHVYHPVVIDPENGEATDLTPGWTRFWRWPGTDDPIDDLAVTSDELIISVDDSAPPHRVLSWSLFRVPFDGGEPRRLDPHRRGHSRRPRFSPSGTVVYGYQAEPDYYASPTRLIELDPATGVERELTPDWDRSADDWLFHSDGTLIVTAEEEGRSRLFRLELDRDPPDIPEPLTQDGWSTRPAQAEDGSVYYLTHSLEHPPEVHSLSTGAPVTDFTAPVLNSIRLGRAQEITVNGAESDPVQVWLVDPPNGSNATPSLVHMIHGGPHGSFGDAWHWRWCAQVIAAAGYRVALVNFHGSTGWGDAFARSIHGAWGDLPRRDIDAVTDHLISAGMADPDRVAITGGSYGGYLVAWITSQTDRYACAIAHAAVTNLGAMYASDMTQGLARAYGADIWEDPARVDVWSPAAHSGGYSTPTLVIHGGRDARVPDTQGLELYGVLKARGIPSRLVYFPTENHWVLSSQGSIRWYDEVLAWLDRWL